MPIVGFLPVEDERIAGTVRAIEKHLMRDGFLLRYDTHRVKDGLPAGEGAFLACNFWLIDVYLLQGRVEEAKSFFERLSQFVIDVGLLSRVRRKAWFSGEFPPSLFSYRPYQCRPEPAGGNVLTPARTAESSKEGQTNVLITASKRRRKKMSCSQESGQYPFSFFKPDIPLQLSLSFRRIPPTRAASPT